MIPTINIHITNQVIIHLSLNPSLNLNLNHNLGHNLSHNQVVVVVTRMKETMPVGMKIKDRVLIQQQQHLNHHLAAKKETLLRVVKEKLNTPKITVIMKNNQKNNSEAIIPIYQPSELFFLSRVKSTLV